MWGRGGSRGYDGCYGQDDQDEKSYFVGEERFSEVK